MAENFTKDEILFIKNIIKPHANDKPKTGWDPRFYHTLSYEGDLALWNSYNKIYEKIIKVEKSINK